jgi:hypothetical protein
METITRTCFFLISWHHRLWKKLKGSAPALKKVPERRGPPCLDLIRAQSMGYSQNEVFSLCSFFWDERVAQNMVGRPTSRRQAPKPNASIECPFQLRNFSLSHQYIRNRYSWNVPREQAHLICGANFSRYTQNNEIEKSNLRYTSCVCRTRPASFVWISKPDSTYKRRATERSKLGTNLMTHSQRRGGVVPWVIGFLSFNLEWWSLLYNNQDNNYYGQ